ncbi:MAG: hypothetical protein Q9Q40_04610 [Acidobacteriota bacterium]|nr:hypothetical protein [Acidobacteriota bacterium]
MSFAADRRWAAGLLVAALALALFHGLSFGLCLQDDAFISLRYSRNLAEGLGLVYNPGERVEGFTNMLWTLLLTLPFRLRFDPISFTRVVGIASGMSAVAAAFFLARRLEPEQPLAASAAAGLVASLPFFMAESAMGLETAAFAALAAAGVAQHLREEEDGRGRGWLGGAILAAAAWTRPEGLLVAGVLGLADLLRGSRTRRLSPCFLPRWITFAAAAGPLFAFRWLYYGDLVPNTARAKVGGGLAAVARGIDYLFSFGLAALPLLLAAAVGAFFLFAGARRRWIWPTLVIPLFYLIYVTIVGGDYKPTFRFFATPAVFFAALAGVGLARAARALRSNILPFPVLLGGTLVIGGVLFSLGSDVRGFAAWRAAQLPVHRAAGRWLGDHFPAESWLATGNAGVLPYESGLPTIDMYGLCDRHIAMREMPAMGHGAPGHEKGDGSYVLERRPTVILFQFARFTDSPASIEQIGRLRMSVSEREIWADPRFLQHYDLRSARLPGFYFNYFQKKLQP